MISVYFKDVRTQSLHAAFKAMGCISTLIKNVSVIVCKEVPYIHMVFKLILGNICQLKGNSILSEESFPNERKEHHQRKNNTL